MSETTKYKGVLSPSRRCEDAIPFFRSGVLAWPVPVAVCMAVLSGVRRILMALARWALVAGSYPSLWGAMSAWTCAGAVLAAEAGRVLPPGGLLAHRCMASAFLRGKPRRRVRASSPNPSSAEPAGS